MDFKVLNFPSIYLDLLECSSLVVSKEVQGEGTHEYHPEYFCQTLIWFPYFRLYESKSQERKISREAITGHRCLEKSSPVGFWLTINVTRIQLATRRLWTNNTFIKNSLSFHLKKPITNLIWNASKHHHFFCKIIQKFSPTTYFTLIPRRFCSVKAHWVCAINFIHYNDFL